MNAVDASVTLPQSALAAGRRSPFDERGPKSDAAAAAGDRRRAPASKRMARRAADLGVDIDAIPDTCLYPTGRVVGIARRRNSRVGVGKLSLMSNGSKAYAFFTPNDSRCPRMMVPRDEVDPSEYGHHALHVHWAVQTSSRVRKTSPSSSMRAVPRTTGASRRSIRAAVSCACSA